MDVTKVPVGVIRNHHTLSNLKKALDTFRERNKTYGDNYKNYGKVMVALFPEGVQIKTVDDWNRHGIINMIVSKLTRYVADPHNGHHDSMHDMGVYCHMLEEIDAGISGLDTSNPDRIFVATEGVLRAQMECEHVWKRSTEGMRADLRCLGCTIWYSDWLKKEDKH